MMPQHLVRDLMQRTLDNLRFIEGRSTPDGPYEVTQLVNSFLAGLAHPWEEYKQELNQETIADATDDGWPELPKEKAEDTDPESLGDLLRLVRNSFAHGNIEFRSTGGMEVTHIRFWNVNKQGRRTWGTIASIQDMRLFLERFVDLAGSLTAEQYERSAS